MTRQLDGFSDEGYVGMKNTYQSVVLPVVADALSVILQGPILNLRETVVQ